MPRAYGTLCGTTTRTHEVSRRRYCPTHMYHPERNEEAERPNGVEGSHPKQTGTIRRRVWDSELR